ncbi:MAG: CoA ester lyase [Acidothermales bacterium]|nr:CoA ester lyase [Acidothermales bacterium]
MDLRAARAFLFVPATRPDRFEKASAAGADVVVLDLEDAVAPDDKDTARASAAKWLSAGGPAMVRINSTDTSWYARDVAMAADTGCPVMLPKAASGEQVRRLVASLGSGARVVPLVETSAGVLGARDVCAVPGVARVALGGIDLGAELGVDPEAAATMAWARSMLVFASAAAGAAPPVDGVTTDIRDAESLRAQAVRGVHEGFGGKLCIHPAQVPVVRDAYRPSAEQLAWARRVVAAAEDRAVVVVDGKMVDKPVLERARRLLADAR